MTHSKVPNIGDIVRHLVAASSVLGAGVDASKFSYQSTDDALLVTSLRPVAFENHGTGHHTVRVESLDA